MKKVLLSPTPPRPLRWLASALRAPFKGLWIVLLAYYAASFYFVPHSQIRLGNLPDPDDYMYLDQLINWLQGQGWYDLVQHRINPPEGMVIPFARLAMLPMAVLVLPLRAFGVEIHQAALAMAAVYPLILLGCLFIAVRDVAARFVPRSWAGASGYALIASLALIYMFQPGHVDHHGLIILLTALALGCALRMMEASEDWRGAAAAGAILALALSIALEALPWLLVIAGWLGLRAVFAGGKPARGGFVFGLALFCMSALCLLLAQPPGNFLVLDPVGFSAVYVLLTAGIALCFVLVALARNARLPVRIIVGAAAAFGGGFGFLWCFPELHAGPYGAIDPQLTAFVLDQSDEAAPLFTLIPHPGMLAGHLAATLLAMGLGGWFLARGTKPGRWPWGLVAAMLFAGCGLAVFYQSRFTGVMEMASVIPLTAFLYHGWAWIGARRLGDENKFVLRLGLLLVFVPLPGVVLPYLADPAGFGEAGLIWFPASGNTPSACGQQELAGILDDPRGLGAKQHMIAADTWLGPELLFRTGDAVIAAPYVHWRRDGAGNLDAFRFFATPDPAEARGIAGRHCADLVLACMTYPAAWLQQTDGGAARKFGGHFIELLLGKTPPGWLRAVDLPAIDNFALFEVTETERGEKKACPAR